MKLKLLGTEKEPLSLKLGDNIKVDLGSRIFKSLNVTENGTYVGGQEDGMLVGFTPVTVNVKSTIEHLTVTENGTYNSEEIDGYKPVVVDVPVPSDTTAQVGDILEGKTAYIEGLKQIGILKAKKFTTGTVTFATASASHIVTHNLGSRPSFFALYPSNMSDFTASGTDEAKGKVISFVSVIMPENLLCQADYQGNINTGNYMWNTSINAGGGRSYITETTIRLGTGHANNYKYSANIEYSWIAIE